MATKTSTARQSTAPARKPTKAKAPKKVKARAKANTNTLPSRAKGDFANDMNITVLAKKNPHQTGTKDHQRFALYKKGMTVGDVLAAMKKVGYRNRRGTVRKDWHKGHIRIEGAKS